MGFKKQLLLYFGRIELSDAPPRGSTPSPPAQKKVGKVWVYLSFTKFIQKPIILIFV